MSPANPEHIGRCEGLSDDYHDDKATIDFYTNSAIRIYRGSEDVEEQNIWLDNLEKRELLRVLKEEIEESG